MPINKKLNGSEKTGKGVIFVECITSHMSYAKWLLIQIWIEGKETMDYYSALLRSGKILDSYFEQSKDILHSASKGSIRENILNKVIRPFLPSCYGLSGGEAFDASGKSSKQLDLVIYDAVFSYVVPYIENYIQFPFESVYGNVEIKSFLNKEEFVKAIDNIASLKKLSRRGTHSWQVTPQVSITIDGLPNNTNRNPCFGMVFAYDSVEIESIIDYIRNLEICDSFLPNAIVLYSKKTLIIQANDSQVQAFPCTSFNKYTVLNCGEDILAVFIGLLINYTRYTLLSVADVPAEVTKTLGRILQQNNENNLTRIIDLNINSIEN